MPPPWAVPVDGEGNRCGGNTPLLLGSVVIGHDILPRTAVGITGDGILHETLGSLAVPLFAPSNPVTVGIEKL